MGFFKKAFDFVIHPSNSRTMSIVIMLFFLAAVSFTVIVAQQQQQLKQRADSISCEKKCETEFISCREKINTPGECQETGSGSCVLACIAKWETCKANCSKPATPPPPTPAPNLSSCPANLPDCPREGQFSPSSCEDGCAGQKCKDNTNIFCNAAVKPVCGAANATLNCSTCTAPSSNLNACSADSGTKNCQYTGANCASSSSTSQKCTPTCSGTCTNGTCSTGSTSTPCSAPTLTPQVIQGAGTSVKLTFPSQISGATYHAEWCRSFDNFGSTNCANNGTGLDTQNSTISVGPLFGDSSLSNYKFRAMVKTASSCTAPSEYSTLTFSSDNTGTGGPAGLLICPFNDGGTCENHSGQAGWQNLGPSSSCGKDASGKDVNCFKPIPPTPTIAPTATPAPTTAPAPTAVPQTLNIGLKVQDEVSASDNLSVNISVYNFTTGAIISSLPASQTFASTAVPDKPYAASISLTNLPVDKYFMILRKNNMIAKAAFTISSSTPTITIQTPPTLVFGDINNNNNIDILDYNLLRPCFKEPSTGSCASADFDGNQTVDQIDINAWLKGARIWNTQGK